MKNGLKSAAVIVLAFFLLLSFSYADDCKKKGTKEVYNEKVCTPQCVDFVKCHLGITYHLGNARQWWSTPPPGYHKHDNGRSSQEPKKNDIVYENVGKYGHISVIIDVNEKKKKIRIAQTNYPDPTKCEYSEHTFGYSRNKDRYKINGPKVLGWLSRN